MASLFRDGTELMVQYARYHRDRRNILSHFIGIPMIVFAIGVLLSRPSFGPGLTPAVLLWAVSALWYLSRRMGVTAWATVAVNGVLIALAHAIPAESTAAWLTWGVGAFVLGWVIQFVGHYWEGRKPAFADDLVGLLVGPAFVVAEWLFAIGLAKDMEAVILQQVGPVRTGATQTLT